MNNYTNNYVNMMNYLCQKITNYVLNNFVNSIINNNYLSLTTLYAPPPNTATPNPSPPPRVPQSTVYELFYANKVTTNPVYSLITYTIIIDGTPMPSPTPSPEYYNTKWQNDTYIAFESYRIVHKISYYGVIFYPVYNLRYDLSYLNNQPFTPTPYVTGTDGTKYPLLLLLSKIAPKIYLEICTSYVNNFFVNLFQNYDTVNNITSTSPQTVNGINQWCIQNNYIDVACGSDKSNKRCACQTCYNMHSYQDRIIAKELMKSKTVNNNPWCLYPQCSQGSAFKDQLNITRSVCSNVSVAGVFIEPNDYSNINVSNTSVTASSYNNTGINIINNEGCNKCILDNKDCVVTNSQLTCVDKSQNNLSRNLSRDLSINNKGSNKGSGNSNNIKFILLIIMTIILITLIIFRISYNNNTKIKYILDICIFLSIILLVVFSFVIKNKEHYTFPNDLINVNSRICPAINLCQKETPCKDTNTLCINNECMYPIGSFYDTKHKKIVDFPSNDSTIVYDAIITNITHAPEHYFTGFYYYSTVINNSIYLCAQNCNLMYDGSKWKEISPNPDQTGFNPEVTIPVDLKQFYYGKCFTYNNEIYIPQFYNGTDQNKIIKYYIYNTSINIWRIMDTSEILYPNLPSYLSTIDDKGNLYIVRNFNDGVGRHFRIYLLNLDTKKENVFNIDNASFLDTFSYAYINIIDNFMYIMVVNGSILLYTIDLNNISMHENYLVITYL